MIPTDDSARISPAQVEAVDVGQHEVEQHDVGLRWPATSSTTSLPVRDTTTVKPRTEQVGPHEVDDVAGRPRRRGRGWRRSPSSTGSRSAEPGVDRIARASARVEGVGRARRAASTSDGRARSRSARGGCVPPWAPTMPRAMARPSPAPGPCGRPALVGQEDAARAGSAGRCPAPSSATRTLHRLARRRRARRSRRPGSSPAAWRTAFSKQVDEHLLEAVVVGPDGRERRRSRRARTAQAGASVTQAPGRVEHQAEIAPVRHAGAASPESMALKSSRSPTSRPMRADSDAIESRNRCWDDSSQLTSGWRSVDA